MGKKFDVVYDNAILPFGKILYGAGSVATFAASISLLTKTTVPDYQWLPEAREVVNAAVVIVPTTFVLLMKRGREADATTGLANLWPFIAVLAAVANGLPAANADIFWLLAGIVIFIIGMFVKQPAPKAVATQKQESKYRTAALLLGAAVAVLLLPADK